MARIRAEIVRSTLPTSGSTVDYTFSGLGFTPTFALIVASKTTSDGSATDGGATCYGYAVDGSQFVHSIAAEDAVGTGSNTWSRDATDVCVMLMDPTDGSVECEMGFNSFISNGIRLDVDTAASSAWKVSILLKGGTGLEVHAGTFTTTSDGNAVDVTDPGFPVEYLLTFPGGSADTPISGLNAFLGFASKHGSAPTDQSCLAWRSDDGGSTTSLAIRNETREASINVATSGAVSGITTAGDFDASGFSITGTITETTTRHYVAFGTDDRVEHKIGLATAPNSAPSTWTETGVGFPSQLVLMLQSHQNAVNSTDTGGADVGYWGVGFFTDSDETSHGQQDQDGQSSSNTATFADAKAVSTLTGTAAVSVTATYTSMDSDGFTLGVTAAPTGAGRKFPFLALSEDRSLDASDSGSTTPAGALTGSGALAGSSAGDTTPAGLLSGLAGLVGSSAASTIAAGLLVAIGALVGSASGSTATTGELTAASELSGSSAGSTTSAGALVATGELDGSSAGSTTPAATIAGSGALAGDSSGSTATSGTLDGIVELAGTSAGSTSAAGALIGNGSLAGTASGATAPSGALVGSGALAGTAAGSTATTGVLTELSTLSGSSSGSTTTGGALVGAGDLAGAAGGSTSPSGALSGLGDLAGAASGSTAPAGLLGGLGGLSGTSAGSTVTTGDLTAEAGSISGSSAGSTTAVGALVGWGDLAGSSAGSTTTTGSFMDTAPLSEIMANAAKAVRLSLSSVGLTDPIAWPNAPFDRPASGPWVSLVIPRMSLRITSFGPGSIGLKLTGAARITVYGRLGRLDSSHRDTAQQIADFLEGYESIGGVRFLGTSVSSPRPERGRWALDVEAEFEDNATIANPRGAPNTVPVSYRDMAEAMRSRFETEIATPEGIRVVHDDMLRPPSGPRAPWARVSVLDARGSRFDTGVRQAPVSLSVQLFVPLHTGDGRAWELASRIVEPFTALTEAGLTYLDSEVSVAGAGTSYWQTNIVCRAQYERPSL